MSRDLHGRTTRSTRTTGATRVAPSRTSRARAAHGRVHGHARTSPRRRIEQRPAPRAAQRARTTGPRPLQKRAASTRSTARRSPALRLTFRAGDTRKRLIVVFVASTLVFGLVIARVAFLQTFGSDDLLAAGKAQRVTESVLHAPRGTVFARDGAELALSVPSSTLFADPRLVTDPAGTASVLAAMLQLSQEKQQALAMAFAAKEKSFVYIAREVDDELAKSVMAMKLAGIDVLREEKRTMPSGAVGRSVLGRTDIDGIGIAGLELQFDELLTGVDGERVREHDRNGRSIPGSGATTTEPIPGDDLVLTLDRSLQFQVEQALLARTEQLKAKGGTVVVMATATGEIYAMANVERSDDGIVRVTSANLAAVEPFEPGSVAKVFSISAVVDLGAANPDTTIRVPGKLTFDEDTQWKQTISDAKPHDEMAMSLRDIVVESSNIGTLLMARQIGTKRFGDYLDAFGFGHRTAVDFPGESAGIIKPASEWQGTEKATVSFGYGYSATALQLVAAVNTVANDGMFVEPKLVKATIDAKGIVTDTDPSQTRRVLKPQTAATMTSMMRGVVCEGTGQDARIPGISVAGKTGTAYKAQNGAYKGLDGSRAYRASFAGYLPADNPQVTILVSIDEPDPTSNDRFGGKAAAPLFAQIATSAIHEMQLTPSPGDSGCPAAG